LGNLVNILRASAGEKTRIIEIEKKMESIIESNAAQATMNSMKSILSKDVQNPKLSLKFAQQVIETENIQVVRDS